MGDDPTVEILNQIRDGIAGMRGDFNERLDGVKAQIGALNDRVDALTGQVGALREEAGQRLGRVEQGLNDLGQFMRQIAIDQTKYERFHVHHVEILEKDMEDLRTRVGRLEQKSG